MDTPQELAKREFEHSTENTRLENQPNALLEHVKAQVLEQMKARVEKGSEQDAKHAFGRK
jgi:hypothetical protein